MALISKPEKYEKKSVFMINFGAKLIRYKYYETILDTMLRILFTRNISDFPEMERYIQQL